ncbi:MAG: VTT domain-containing protein [Polyangiaceae bacterium]
MPPDPPDATASTPTAAPPPARAPGREVARLVAQVVVPLGVLFLGVSVVATLFRQELRTLGEAFVHRFGYAGMAFGAFVSDAFNFPIPPQFYMLTSVAAGAPQVPSVLVVCAASVVAANVAYFVAGTLAKVPFVARRIEAARPTIDPLFAKYGYYAVAIGAMSPIPFSLLCYVAGLYKVPYRIYALLVLMRVPRLLVFYALIRLGWG